MSAASNAMIPISPNRRIWIWFYVAGIICKRCQIIGDVEVFVTVVFRIQIVGFVEICGSQFLRGTESTERTIFLPDRETVIGQTGNPPEGWDSKRSAEKRTQPCGHRSFSNGANVSTGSLLVSRIFRRSRMLLFPGRILPAREKTIFSVASVSLW